MKVILLTTSEHLKAQEINAASAMLIIRGKTLEGRLDTPAELLFRIIERGHESILEHINLTFRIEKLSRACLQELARHRHISLSVESMRHVLKNKLDLWIDMEAYPVADVLENEIEYAPRFLNSLYDVFEVNSKITYDELSYYVPEFFSTNLILTANVRALRHILKLHSAPEELQEFQILCRELFKAVPNEFKYLFEDCLYKENIS